MAHEELQRQLLAQKAVEKRAARKARQRACKAREAGKADRRDVNSSGKTFAATVLMRYPHLEWNSTEFIPDTPAPSPRLDMKVTLMLAAYNKLGIEWLGSRKAFYGSYQVKALADSGFQTCTA